MKAVVFTLGCKVNRYESDFLAQELEKIGYEVTDEPVYADLYILNTCAVTQEAEKKSRQAVTRCRKCNPEGKIFVIGCASQNHPDSFVKDNVVYIGGTATKKNVLAHLNDEIKIFGHNEPSEEFEDMFLYRPTRTRSFIKIQDGCDRFCTYCLIPYLRGRSRSRNLAEIVREAQILSETTPEIVLTGINVMAYGQDNGESLDKLVDALRTVNARIRLSSFYAEGITESLLDKLFSLQKFCPHFHLSLQSGDADVLKKMNRHYTPEEYMKKIDLIRSYDKNASVATDIIVGFPTETDKGFKNSYNFAKEAAFSDLHVFPFSAREGTAAYKMPGVDKNVIEQRKEKMLGLKKDLRVEFLKKNIGIEHEVLIEEKAGDLYCGYSRNYIKIYTDENEGIVKTRPHSIYKDGLQ